MHKAFLLSCLFLSIAFASYSQPDLSYYLPDAISYDTSIPTPSSVIGHEVGEWHVTHDRMITYLQALDRASDRISLEVTGYTHEARPLLLLTITSRDNHANLESIRTQHLELSNASKSGTINTARMPAVFYIGFSIHGNEASGVNAALLVAYHLAAAKGPEIEHQLANTIILFDPCYNPDGMQRFSSWVNAKKSKVISADPLDMEHNEAWPGGRFNHYWFDLNRDWLVAQHPESQARIKTFHRWKPNVLTDHHEMGTNATFFFQPGVQSRMHPLTPQENYQLTRRMGEYHAKALDALGSLYFTQEDFDDFYYGKGSTFPDIHGAVGILFEQASSRGHAQESANGVLRFPFTIRNQFATALSSLKAVSEMKEDLLNYQRKFYRDAATEASKDPVKAILVTSKDKARVFHFSQLLSRQEIDHFKIKADQSFNGKSYSAENSFVIPFNQKQYRLLKSMFEKRTQFKDSLFYDISSWTLPLAFGLEYEELKAVPRTGEKIVVENLPAGKREGGKSTYAYVFESVGYYAPRSIYRLLQHNVRLKVATSAFHHSDGKRFEAGSILVPLAGQDINAAQIEYLMDEIASIDGIDVHAFATGLDFNGASLGSNSFVSLMKPEIAMLIGDGFSATDAGELWHLIDTRFEMPVTLLPVDVFNRSSISRYTTIIVPPTSAVRITDVGRDKLKNWVQQGGVLIGFESALNWLSTAGLGKFQTKKRPSRLDSAKQRSYATIEAYRGAQQTSGAIFHANADLTHPLLFGYYGNTMPLFKSNNLFMEKSKNPYANPLVFTKEPLLSGYISEENYALLKESSAVGVSVLGSGRIIGFTENMAFRGFWFGTNKMIMNAIFYGSMIDAASSR